MTKTIEEAAKKAIIDNNFFMADPNNPSFVDRGLEQMRACKWVINHIFSLPLASRLTAEEKESIKETYKYHLNAIGDCYTHCMVRDELEHIFGKDFFKEGE